VHGVTILQLVPELLRALVEEPDLSLCRSLRRVVCGGSPLNGDLAERFFERLPGAQLHNLYGPTEATIDATSWTCRRESLTSRIPIGRPIANMRAYVVDEALEPVPIGVAGELLIAGDSLARGYWNRPDATAAAFVPDALSGRAGSRVYRTGDLACWTPRGHLDFLGRKDHQVKIRGFRVEPGEVEVALRGHPGLRDAAVVARTDVAGEIRLVAYYLPVPVDPPGSADLHQFLAQRLPSWMVPSAFVPLEKFPLTGSGKVNRRALPPPDRRLPPRAVLSKPRNAVEEMVAGIWEDVLGLEAVGIEERFFEIGGHSLSAMRVLARLRESLQVDLPLARLFASPTVAALAAACLESSSDPARLSRRAQRLLNLRRLSEEELKGLSGPKTVAAAEEHRR
jgi:acyl carrier protein